MNLRQTFLILTLHILFTKASASETYQETLQLKPLPDGKISARFEFKTLLATSLEDSVDDDRPHHYRLFPLVLGELLRAHSISELHLSLNAGKWDYDKWSYPIDQGVASGAELWVWMSEGGPNATSVDQRWKDLSNGLAGLFCASLGGLDETRTTKPQWAFAPEGDLNVDQSYHLRHAFLPSESVCTENLTPFLKLLPCKGKSGLASLLNPHPLFGSDWHGIGVHVRSLARLGVELKMTFGAAMNPMRTSRGKRDWSLETLFGRQITASCPVAAESSIQVSIPTDAAYQLIPEPTAVDRNLASYDLTTVSSPLSISMSWPQEQQYQYAVVVPPSAPITSHRIITGGSQSRGGILFNFINRQNVSQEITCVETAPWFINYFLNTRRTTVNGIDRDDIVQHTAYTLPRNHQPSLLETVLRLPPHSETQMFMSFVKSFIAYTEHPPDAERGWDLPAAAVAFTLPADTEPERRIYTRNLLIDLPTPDFSMPYNVIIMSSTVIALFFGSVFNLLTRKFVWVKTTEVDVVHQ
ncbi:Subunit of the glycosylphosphatidylinositol transamidase complex-like protein [Tulasnella sp. 427]|nr:Subunit of the glycosylphosphatidylinositol transamidase complex-like protein [Tulasnella sp. 427]